MAAAVQFDALEKSGAEPVPALAYYSIVDLAKRWRCSRGTVYNIIRGEKVLDFAVPGHKGKKLVPAEVVRAIEQRKMKVWR